MAGAIGARGQADEPVEFALVVSGLLQQPAVFPEPMPPPSPQAAGGPT
jgi:hypothetical protein